MWLPVKISWSFISLLLLLSLASCSGGNAAQEAPAVAEAYLKALADKDENGMISFSCADWEAQARLEYNSFAAVEVALENPSCQVSGQDGQFTLVACSGKIVASYSAEDLVIDLSERTYLVIQEGGEWRMCGYR